MKTIAALFLVIFSYCCLNSASAQWVQQNNPTGFYINDMSFVNNNTGWACFDGLCKTTNGGTNWDTLQRPEGNALLSIHFLDANTGFIGSFRFWKTTNGGSSWTNINLSGSNFSEIYFINSLTGWVVTTGNSHIYRTTDGGNNWTEIYYSINNSLTSVNFINVNTGWSCGYHGNIINTTNGGTNWTNQNSGTAENLFSISFSDANTGRVTGDNGTYLRTTNGGANWMSVAAPFGSFFNKLFFINSSSGWIAGHDGLAFTTNNGTNWIDQTPAANCKGISYISPNTIYIGAFNIWKSTTGGFDLDAPTNLTLTPATTSSINLSWTDNSDEDKFMIERSLDGSTGWTLIDSVSANVTTYQNTGLSYNTDYYYRVYAKRIIFTGGASSSDRMRTKLNAPANASPVNDTLVTNSTPTLSWSAVSGGLVYNCQIATDAAFTNIIYTSANSGSTSQGIPSGILQSSTRYYWRSKAINIITYSDYSSAASFIVQDPNYGHNLSTSNNLYYFANSTSGADLSASKPTYNWRDTTGSTNLILNRTIITPISLGDIDDGRFDLIGKLPAGNSIRFFGTNYQNIYVGTNGIVGFTAFSTAGAGNIQPGSSLPQANITNAIFPLWKDLNFGDADVPVNRLCYKVTSNEIIITYMRAPNYNGASDPNDYVSFQVVISHSASPSANSNINLEYNYTQTGSTFISSYNTNTLNTHLIGIQGANSSSQILQYRYSDVTHALISSGPMFGSDLAVAFGPNSALLPVELASFTSSVNGNSTKLEWSTVNELNNSGFDIERKISGSNEWKKISFVSGHGTTNNSQNYSYEDKNIVSGKYQYRLKQIDFNGNYEYFNLSNEIEIGVPKKFNLSQNYPNPFNPATKISFELPKTSKVKLSVYDITGKLASELVNGQREAGYYTIEFNGSSFASGMYFYRIEADEFTSTKKMILVK